MTIRLNTFDWLSPYYDRAARLVFGAAIAESQRYFLRAIPEGADILVLGGGAGDLLLALSRTNPSSHIWYVEASSAMLRLAERKVPATFVGSITFVHGTEDAIPSELSFDAIVTPFILDLFPEYELKRLCETLRRHLRPKGMWLVTDFVDARWWHRALLRLMYIFFGLTCGIAARALPPWQKVLRSVHMKEQEGAMFFKGFIRSSLWITSRAEP